mgnify:CR=1 FL=1
MSPQPVGNSSKHREKEKTTSLRMIDGPMGVHKSDLPRQTRAAVHASEMGTRRYPETIKAALAEMSE